MRSGPATRRLGQARVSEPSPGVTVSELLTDEHGSGRLHQRLLRFAGGAALGGTVGGRGEAWYVTSGSGALDPAGSGTVGLERGTAVWLPSGLRYRCHAQAGQRLEVLAVLVRTESSGNDADPGLCVARLETSVPERAGDREFRVLLSSGLAITQFAGLIPPGRAPVHQHPYDEVVHVLAGQGVVHLGGTQTEIGPGTSIYLPPDEPHCLENTGPDMLHLLGVFYPAGSPAAKRPA
jgi:mannose-6-phosphate isomerase-like protein (cupin superfamily)